MFSISYIVFIDFVYINNYCFNTDYSLMKSLQKLCLFIFLLCTAMTCEDEFVYRVSPTGFELTHTDNSGERPLAVDTSVHIKKEAYVLKVDLSLVDERGESNFSPDHTYQLDNPIKDIQVLSLDLNNNNLPIYKDVTGDFKCYQIDDKPGNYKIIPLSMTYIESVVNPTIYMALLNILKPGEYQFKVNIVLMNDNSLEHTTGRITLY